MGQKYLSPTDFPINSNGCHFNQFFFDNLQNIIIISIIISTVATVVYALNIHISLLSSSPITLSMKEIRINCAFIRLVIAKDFAGYKRSFSNKICVVKHFHFINHMDKYRNHSKILLIQQKKNQIQVGFSFFINNCE